MRQLHQGLVSAGDAFGICCTVAVPHVFGSLDVTCAGFENRVGSVSCGVLCFLQTGPVLDSFLREVFFQGQTSGSRTLSVVSHLALLELKNRKAVCCCIVSCPDRCYSVYMRDRIVSNLDVLQIFVVSCCLPRQGLRTLKVGRYHQVSYHFLMVFGHVRAFELLVLLSEQEPQKAI